jgi:hypothetical protein
MMTTIEALTPILVRSIMRYLSGALISIGGIDLTSDAQLMTDLNAVIVILVAAVLGGIAEVWRAKTTVKV